MGNYCNSDKKDQQFIRRKSSQSNSLIIDLDKANLSKNCKKSFLSQFFSSSQNLCSYQVEIIGKVGNGDQASIYQCRIIQSGLFYSHKNVIEAAAKVYQKQKIQNNGSSIKSIILQNSILTKFECPFIMKAYALYQDDHLLQYYLPLAKGGNLNFFFQSTTEKGKQFRQLRSKGIKFVLCGIIIALQYLHDHNIVYKNLKLENVMIDSQGYPEITNFGLAIKENQLQTASVKRSTHYLAPQLMYQDYPSDHGVDYWSLGILLYFMIFEKYPFFVNQVQSLQFDDLCRQKEGKYSLIYVANLKKDAQRQNLEDLLNKLLVAHSKDRIGVRDIDDIKNHAFFRQIDWNKYQNKQYQSPLISIVKKYPIIIEQFQKPKIVTRSKIKGFRNNLKNSLSTIASQKQHKFSDQIIQSLDKF